VEVTTAEAVGHRRIAFVALGHGFSWWLGGRQRGTIH
jgi:hypothetical protein